MNLDKVAVAQGCTQARFCNEKSLKFTVAAIFGAQGFDSHALLKTAGTKPNTHVYLGHPTDAQAVNKLIGTELSRQPLHNIPLRFASSREARYLVEDNLSLVGLKRCAATRQTAMTKDTEPITQSVVTVHSEALDEFENSDRKQRSQVVVIDGPDNGRAVNLESTEIIIGTDDDCDLVLTDDRVSRRHIAV